MLFLSHDPEMARLAKPRLCLLLDSGCRQSALFGFIHKIKSRSNAKHPHKINNKMKFFAPMFATLLTAHAAFAISEIEEEVKRNLKGRTTNAVNKKASSGNVAIKEKPRQLLQSLHLPAESRIVGGTEAPQGKYPFFVQGDGCGASLIWEDVVLTAAHCQGAFDGSVYVGPSVQYNTSGGAEQIQVQRQVPHPSYSSNTEAYDFMLLKLKDPVSNPTLTPIAVNDIASNPSSNDVLTVIGFGATTEGGYGSSRLREVDVNYIDYQTCDRLYSGEIVDSVMMCAGVPGGGKDSCQGDSGGPIVDQDGNLVGVVSWGYGCAREGFPGVYSRVSGVKDWIDQNVCDLSSNPPASCGASGNGGNGDSGGNGGVNTGDNEVVIRVTYDDFPMETGWTLRDSSGTTIASQATASFASPGETVVRTVNVADGAYTFEMTDEYADGICCQYGRGEATVTVNGEVAVESDGSFQSLFSDTFDVVGLSSGPSVAYRLDVTYDDYPYETSWSLKSRATGKVVASSGFDEVFTPSFSLSQDVELVTGDEYDLEILDSVGDGMCCQFGNGSIALYAIVDGFDEFMITASNGSFGTSQNNIFTIPELTSRNGKPIKKKPAKKAKKGKRTPPRE